MTPEPADAPQPAVPQWALALEDHLTPPRLLSYMVASHGDKAKALHLYHWNVVVSGAFHEVLSYVEVVLRNAMDARLQSWSGSSSASWWEAGLLDPRGEEDVEAAIGRVRRTPRTHGRVVAELNFGFWRYLLASSYEQTLWTPALQHAFPGLTTKRRSDVAEPVKRLHLLRNRIAHHEPIHRVALTDRLDDALAVLGAVDPAIKTWAVTWCRVPALLAQRP